jgi:hypothetical protein
MSYQDVLGMPLRGFWMLSANVTRLRAEEALDMIDLYWVSNENCGPEDVSTLRKALLERMGEPAKGSTTSSSRDVSPEEHQEGIASLKRLFG